jgi:hypothetical protein
MQEAAALAPGTLPLVDVVALEADYSMAGCVHRLVELDAEAFSRVRSSMPVPLMRHAGKTRSRRVHIILPNAHHSDRLDAFTALIQDFKQNDI